MKNNRILCALLSGAFVLLAFAVASAQEQLILPDERVPAQPVRVKRPSVLRLEALKTDFAALQKRKAALRASLANADAASAESARNALVELEVKLQDLAADIVRVATTVDGGPSSAASRAKPAVTVAALTRTAPPADGPGDPQTDVIKATTVSSDRVSATISVDISGFSGTAFKVEAKDSSDRSLSSEPYEINGERRRAGVIVVDVPLAAVGDTRVIVSSLDETAPATPVAVTIPAPARPAAATPAALGGTRPSRLVGLLLGGTVISQQAENLSQADPFMGFIVGYDDIPSNPLDTDWRLHWRVQSIFQVQPKKEEAPVEGTGEGEDTNEDGTADPPDFRSFIASRKSFDVEMSFWLDRPAKKYLFFGGGCNGIDDKDKKDECVRKHFDHNFRIGPYFAVGGMAYVSKNELKGDDSVKVEDTKDANNNDNTNDQVELDVERAKVDNDIDLFYEGGLIGNFTRGAQEGKTKLFMQVKLGYGRYESLAGFNPGKSGFFNDSRNRFVGKLRIFPMFLDRDPEGTADAAPMFGVEINAGRGPDQIKFFTGIATAFKLLKR